MLSSLKLGCLGRQSAPWWRSFGLPNHCRLPSSSLCLGGRGTPLTPPSSSLSRERSMPRKEHIIRGSAPAHPAPTTVWGARGWPFPHQRPRRWVDLKLPDKPVTSARLSRSWPSGRDEESFHGHLRRQGQTVQTFLPASNTLSSLRSATPTQQVLVCNKRPSSIYLRVAVGRRIRISPPTTWSFVTCGPHDRRHVRFSPTVYGPRTGHTSFHEQGRQGNSFVVSDVEFLPGTCQ